MSDILMEEFLWTCTLDTTAKEISWNPEVVEDGTESNPCTKASHKLIIKNAFLLSPTSEDSMTVVQVETLGYNNKKVSVPIVAMKSGINHQTYVDLLIPGPAKLSLLHGEGPIQLVGSHCIDYTEVLNTEEEVEHALEEVDEQHVINTKDVQNNCSNKVPSDISSTNKEAVDGEEVTVADIEMKDASITNDDAGVDILDNTSLNSNITPHLLDKNKDDKNEVAENADCLRNDAKIKDVEDQCIINTNSSSPNKGKEILNIVTELKDTSNADCHAITTDVEKIVEKMDEIISKPAKNEEPINVSVNNSTKKEDGIDIEKKKETCNDEHSPSMEKLASSEKESTLGLSNDIKSNFSSVANSNEDSLGKKDLIDLQEDKVKESGSNYENEKVAVDRIEDGNLLKSPVDTKANISDDASDQKDKIDESINEDKLVITKGDNVDAPDGKLDTMEEIPALVDSIIDKAKEIAYENETSRHNKMETDVNVDDDKKVISATNPINENSTTTEKKLPSNDVPEKDFETAVNADHPETSANPILPKLLMESSKTIDGIACATTKSGIKDEESIVADAVLKNTKTSNIDPNIKDEQKDVGSQKEQKDVGTQKVTSGDAGEDESSNTAPKGAILVEKETIVKNGTDESGDPNKDSALVKNENGVVSKSEEEQKTEATTKEVSADKDGDKAIKDETKCIENTRKRKASEEISNETEKKPANDAQ